MKFTIIFAVALSFAAAATAQTTSPPGVVLGVSGGRYVFGQVSEYRRDQYLLDTLTGRMWVQICAVPVVKDPKQCAFSALQPIAYSDEKGDLTGFVPHHPAK